MTSGASVQISGPRTPEEQRAHLQLLLDDAIDRLERQTEKGGPDKIEDARVRLEAAQAKFDAHEGTTD